MYLCDTGKGCYSNEYKDFCFEQQQTILDMTDTSQNDFTAYWAKEVAAKFNLDETEVASNYGDDPY